MRTKLSILIASRVFFVITGLSQERSNTSGDTLNQKSEKIVKAPQQPSTTSLQSNAMSKVGFLQGRWEGTERVMMQDGRRQDCLSSDFAEAKLNGTVILFQGTLKVRMSPGTDPIIVYEGIGILSYDENAQNYRLVHFGSDGSNEAYECKLSGKTLLCERRDRDYSFVHITLGVDDMGRWIERGERSEDGKKWHDTFSTQMSKTAMRSNSGQ